MPKKIEKLTPEQENSITECYRKHFGLATITEPADRPRAEAAARRMAEIGGVKVKRVVWVVSPDDGAKSYVDEWASLGDSLVGSLVGSLWDSLWASLGDSLRDSLWDGLGDSGWTAFYSFGRELGVQYAPEADEKLRLHEEIQASAFALWIVPGVVILCERPAKCDVRDGKLVGIEWRTP